MLLYDCDKEISPEEKGSFFRRTVPRLDDHPIETGIENLFGRSALQKAISHKPAFIDVVDEHQRLERGESQFIPEKWTVNKDEKTNLCNWFCENGTQEDFQFFKVIFELLENLLDLQQVSQEKEVVGALRDSESLPDGSGAADREESS